MDRSGLASVFLLLFLTLSIFSDASLISNYRKFSVKKKDSLPGLSGDNKSVEKTVNGTKNGDNKLDSNESSKETKLGSETVNQTSKEEKKLGPNEVNQTNKDNKSDSKIVKEDSGKPKPGSEPENLANKGKELDSGSTENKPSNGEKPVENPKKEESESEKKQSESQQKNEKPGSESGKDDSKEKKPDPKLDPEPQVPKDVPVSKSSSGESAKSSPPPDEKTMKKEDDNNKKKNKDKSESGILTDKSCDGLSLCIIQKDLIGCIENSDDGSQVVVLVQNKGESDLKANVAADSTGKGPEYNIPKKQSKRISVPVTSGKISSIVLHGADSKCELHLHQSVSEETYLFRFPTYDKLVTPVNGAYLLIFSAIIFGATFTCVKLSRKRRQGGGGIPYQELEMGIPESVSAADLETATAEGWDEGWDDDWDNQSLVKSPTTRLAGNISANGLTSRTSNKDGWDDNWDD